MKIAIQGIRGAFHEVAARQFFGDQIDVVPALSFRELFDITQAGERCDGAMVAIENSLAGSILGNYKLLRTSRLNIIGEIFLPIGQHLLTMPGVTIDQLDEVRSHPMALAQCTDFFKQHPHIRLVEADDTAASAERVARRKMKHVGAIAGALAAEIYGLQILAPHIEDNPMNYTRFLAVLPEETMHQQPEKTNKSSICFVTRHEIGCLSDALTSMSRNGANLTKIQSVPIEDKVWEYRFFLDYVFDGEQNNTLILSDLRSIVSDLQVLGTYTASTL
jgi:prephenate dehydratase